MERNAEKRNSIEKTIIEDSKLEVDNLLKKYKTSLEGISVVDVDEKIEEYGKNIIDIKDKNTLLHKLKEAFINPFNTVLMVVAAITLFTDVIISTQKDYATDRKSVV